jgi:glycosyltransferase involved in cell wall biosynthesis
MARVAAIIVNLVPYHHARWDAYAAAGVAETHLVELTDRDEFKVLEFASESAFTRHTLFTKSVPHGSALVRRMQEMLDSIRPDVVCVSGWGLPVSLAAIAWAAPRGVPLVMLSESNEFDEPRVAWKEFIKRRIVSLCSAGVGGGNPQADYLVKLGLPASRVYRGYDVVDNRFFAEEARELGAGIWELGEIKRPYFLACARFGKKKNLPGLIRAYARYRQKVQLSTLDFGLSTAAVSNASALACPAVAPHPLRSLRSSVFDLVIAGDGEERVEIERTIRECGVSDHVHLVGAKGYYDLPAYYANAGAFIHASTTEQWGLVVNEAMASGLPVLVSNRCGCATDLVKEGVNGWTFDPTNEEQMADLMLRISSDEEQRKEMGRKSREIIAEWGPARFASGISSAIDAALSAPKIKVGLLDRLILWAMTRR